MNILFDRPISFYDAVVVGEYAWFCNLYYCALMKMNLNNGITEIVCFLPGCKWDFTCQYAFLERWENKLIIAPRMGQNIIIYDMSDNSIKSIPLKLNYLEKKMRYNLLTNVYVYNDHCYIMPGKLPAIIDLDMRTENLSYIDEWYDEIKQYITSKEKVIFSSTFLNNEGHCILPGWQGDYILDFDMNSLNWRITHEGSGMPLSDGFDDNGTDWFIYRDRNILGKSRDGNVTYFSPQNLDESISGGNMYVRKVDDNVYIFPIWGDQIKVFNMKSCTWGKYMTLSQKYSEEIRTFQYAKTSVLCCRKYGIGKIIVHSFADGKVILIDGKSGKRKELIPKLSNESISIYGDKSLKDVYGDITFENDERRLPDFIYGIQHYGR